MLLESTTNAMSLIVELNISFNFLADPCLDLEADVNTAFPDQKDFLAEGIDDHH